MTPDTSAYMTAGFVVIFSGMGVYLLTLYLRARTIKKKLGKEQDHAQEQE